MMILLAGKRLSCEKPGNHVNRVIVNITLLNLMLVSVYYFIATKLFHGNFMRVTNCISDVDKD
jgi:hypothetical protein